MAQTTEAPVAPPPRADERVGRKSPLARMLARPEAGAIAGAIVIYIFFFIIAPPFRNASSFSSVLYVTSTYGLMATPVALLMIGGEFDLSAGVRRPARRCAPRCSAMSSPPTPGSACWSRWFCRC